LRSDLPDLPVDDTNLIVRAGQIFADAIAGCSAGEVGSAATGSSVGAEQADVKSGSASHQQPAAAASTSIGVGDGVGDVPGAVPPPDIRDGEVAGVKLVNAWLEKKIPLGAGLGGGSSDAARTLLGLNRLWTVNWPVERLAPLAAMLGSDVPFFLYGPSSICMGRGELVRPVSRPLHARWAMLVLPDIHMPTAAVYGKFDELGLGFDSDIEARIDWNEWANRSAKDLLISLVNDLERPAFEIRRDLGTLRSEIELTLGRTVRMSGSGSSLFTLFDEEQEARSAATKISARFNLRALAAEVAPALSDGLG
jgi:4-diphosphocytidyl-2C-methyl-D-erythritol kinase